MAILLRPCLYVIKVGTNAARLVLSDPEVRKAVSLARHSEAIRFLPLAVTYAIKNILSLSWRGKEEVKPEDWVLTAPKPA